MSIEILPSRTIEDLQSRTSIELQEYAGKLYRAACTYQRDSGARDQDAEGHCHTSVSIVEQIRDVAIVLQERGEEFEEDLFEFLFPVVGGTEMASTMDKMFIKYFHCQCPGTIVSTMVALNQDDRAIALTTISADPATRAAQILAMEVAIAQLEGDN